MLGLFGEDETIDQIRQINLPAKSREITFSDRVSFSVFHANKICKLTSKPLEQLCNSFFFGCLLYRSKCMFFTRTLFYGMGTTLQQQEINFWKKFTELVSIKYDLPEIGALEKFSHYCEDIINNNVVTKKLTNNFVYNFDFKNKKINLDSSRSKWGYFYEKNYKI